MSAADSRGQANLLALAAAVVLLTAATVGSVALADRALADADRDPGARHAAEAAGARLVAADANHTRRANVANETALRALNASELDRLAPPVRGRAVRVRLGNETLLERGDPDGPTVRRVVRVEDGTRRSESVDLSKRAAVSLPDRVRRVGVDISVGGDARLTTVRANDRVVLHDATGLEGEYVASVPPVASPRLSFALEDGRNATAVVRWTATNATTEQLAVTVDA